jgi:predicted RNA methylase
VNRVRVRPIPAFVDARRLLGPGEWRSEGDGYEAMLDGRVAADLAARLRGVGLGGHLLEIDIQPPLPRPWVRDARTHDARRRRDTTPGFTRAGTRSDEEGRFSLTPETMALRLGQRAKGRSVVDAGCGVGGNAIGFARAGSPVTAIERDPQRLELARHNARVYGVRERIRFIGGDASALLASLSADILFLDPPWGVEWNRERTTFDDFPLLRFALATAPGRFQAVWAKLPPSFDPSTVPNARAHAWFGEASGDRHRVKFIGIELDLSG